MNIEVEHHSWYFSCIFKHLWFEHDDAYVAERTNLYTRADAARERILRTAMDVDAWRPFTTRNQLAPRRCRML